MNEAEVFQLRDLAADGGVVAPGQLGEFADAQRAAALHAHQQRKQRAIEVDAGQRDQGGVRLGAVEDAVDVQQRFAQLGQFSLHGLSLAGRANGCKIHSLSSRPMVRRRGRMCIERSGT